MRSISSLCASVSNRWHTFVCDHKDFRTSRHIVVFESDDWGSIRMSNKKAWDDLLRLGYAVDKRPYERFDTLESAEDLEALFEVLYKYKDCKGNHPIITANMLMANPDFEKIQKSGFDKYYYEPIESTYRRYYYNASVLELMRKGLDMRLFMPQCHGREHFNVINWMKALQDKNEDTLVAFYHGMCGIAPKAFPEQGNDMMVALYVSSIKDQMDIENTVQEGLNMFEKFWGFKSKSFVAPCYTWNEGVEKVLANNDVELIQTSRKKSFSFDSPCKYYYSGQKNRFNQRYSIRNCKFEPSTNEGGGDLSNIMEQIKGVFAHNKIAVISTHRINYVSGLSEHNRKRTLLLLDGFLKELLNKYPDVEFLSSDKLIEVFNHNAICYL